jgi:hypothetical protein
MLQNSIRMGKIIFVNSKEATTSIYGQKKSSPPPIYYHL